MLFSGISVFLMGEISRFDKEDAIDGQISSASKNGVRRRWKEAGIFIFKEKGFHRATTD